MKFFLRFLTLVALVFSSATLAEDLRVAPDGDAYIKRLGNTDKKVITESDTGYIKPPLKLVGGSTGFPATNGIHLDLSGGNDYAIFESASDIIRFGPLPVIESQGIHFNINGRMGLGTDSPATKLELSSGSSDVGEILRLSSTPDTSGDVVGQIQFYDLSATAAVGAKIRSEANGASTTHDLVFSTNSNTGNGGEVDLTDHMRLDSVGTLQLGNNISASTINGKLVVGDEGLDGWAIVQGSIGSFTNNGVHIGYVSADGRGRIASTKSGGTGYITFEVASGAEAMRIESDGDVGIGVTPSTRLHVLGNGTQNFYAIFDSNSASQNVGFNLKENGVDKWYLYNNNSDDRFYIGDATVANGAYLQQGNSGGWTNYSDRRIKKNIKSLTIGLKEVLKLNPVTFTMKVTDEDGVGFVAQDVKSVIPQVVVGDEKDFVEKEDGTFDRAMGIQYQMFAPVLVKAIQEQQVIIEQQKQWICSQDDAPVALCN